MDEETNKIRTHIDTEREELGRNLDEIEYRVKGATDFKAHFNRNTGLILGAAVAGGFLLSLAFRKSSSTAAQPTHRVTKHFHRLSETLDNIFDGLIGVASAKLQSIVGDAIPGFQAQYDAIDQQRGRSPVHHMKRQSI